MPPQKPSYSVPDGWEVVDAPTIPDGWEVVGTSPRIGANTPRMSAAPASPGILQTGLNTAKDLGIGFAKELGKRGYEGGQLLRKIPGVNLLDKIVAPRQFNLEPSNETQQIGGMIEQGAEFVVPGAKAASFGTKLATKVAPFVGNAPKVVKFGAAMLPRAAAEGAMGAAVTATQGGDPLTGGAVSAALPVVGPVVESVAGGLAKSARKSVGKFLDPASKAMKQEAKGLEQRVLDEGIIGTRNSVLNKATKQTDKAGRAVPVAEAKAIAANPGAVVAKDKLLNTFDKVIKQTTVANEAGELVVKPGQEALHRAATKWRSTVDALGDNLSLEQAIELKKGWQKVAAEAKAYAGATGASVRGELAKAGAGEARKQILLSAPELKAPYGDYKFWRGLKDVLADTTSRGGTGARDIASQLVWKIAAPSVLGGGGYLYGGTEGLVKGAALGAAIKGWNSPITQLAKGQAKSKLSKALTSEVANMTGRALKPMIQGGVSFGTAAPTQEEIEREAILKHLQGF